MPRTQVSTPLLKGCVSLGKSFYFPQPQFLHLWNEEVAFEVLCIEVKQYCLTLVENGKEIKTKKHRSSDKKRFLFLHFFIWLCVSLGHMKFLLLSE